MGEYPFIQGFEVNGITVESKKKTLDSYKLYC